MAFKFVVFVAVLAFANAGVLHAPAAVAYSAAPAVSSSYFQQASVPVAVAHAAPVAVAHAAPVALAHAAPVAVAHAPVVSAPVAVHAPAFGSSHQSVVRSPLGGSISQYSKAVDSAFSSVRKYDTRITNDAVAPVALTHAAPVISAPVATYATHAAPVVSAFSAGPVLAKTAAVAYSPAAVVSHVSFDGLGASYQW